MISINGRFLTKTVSGVERHAIEVTKAIDALLDRPENAALDVRLLAPPGTPRPAWLRRIAFEVVGRSSGYMWEQLDLFYHTRRDVLLNFGNLGPILHKRQILCIHDVNYYIIPQNYPRLFQLIYKLLTPILCRVASRIVTVSNFSKNNLYKFKICPPDKPIHVLSNGYEHLKNREIVPLPLPNKPYIAMIGGEAYNKNLAVIAAIAPRLRACGFDVLVTGNRTSSLRSAAGGTDRDAITFVGHIEDRQLAYLIQNAHCLVYPSFCEGFGIPPLEAMVLRCPAIVSNTSSLPEICGDAALFASPTDPEAWFEAILALRDTARRRTLIARGAKRCMLFSWQRTAQHYLQMAKELLPA